MAKSEGELQCVGKLEVVRPNSSSKPVGFLCGSIPVPTDNSFHAFNSSALVPSLHHTYSLSLSLSLSLSRLILNFELLIFDFCIDTNIYIHTEWALRDIGCFRRRRIWIRRQFLRIPSLLLPPEVPNSVTIILPHCIGARILTDNIDTVQNSTYYILEMPNATKKYECICLFSVVFAYCLSKDIVFGNLFV